MMRILVINGPNLNLLGTREPAIYGSTTLLDLTDQVKRWAGDMGIDVEAAQSNSEGRIVDLVQGFDGDGIVINPGAFTHTSRAIADAISAVTTPVVEVHLSNVHEREPWRAVSVVSDACVQTIYGRGVVGYRDALRHLLNRSSMPFETVRYGPHAENVGDLRHGDHSLVILAHGGLWRHEHTRDSTESLAVDLATRGFTTWNLEYRRVGLGGGWPASAHDVLTALDHVPQLGLNVSQVILVGHSAGAQLSMWAAPRSSTSVALHVALGPLLDIRSAAESGGVGSAEANALLAQGAPPLVMPEGVPTILVHGGADQIVPVQRSIEFAQRNDLDHHRTGCDHFSLLDPSKPEWSWVIDRIQAVS